MNEPNAAELLAVSDAEVVKLLKDEPVAELKLRPDKFVVTSDTGETNEVDLTPSGLTKMKDLVAHLKFVNSVKTRSGKRGHDKQVRKFAESVFTQGGYCKAQLADGGQPVLDPFALRDKHYAELPNEFMQNVLADVAVEDKEAWFAKGVAKYKAEHEQV